MAGPDELTSDLATQAGLRAIASAGLIPNDIELLIVATATPDRKLPSTEFIVQAKLGITNKSPAFDLISFAAVGSGWTWGSALYPWI